MVTAGADLGAARHRVPRRISPFDRRLLAHAFRIELPFEPVNEKPGWRAPHLWFSGAAVCVRGPDVSHDGCTDRHLESDFPRMARPVRRFDRIARKVGRGILGVYGS